MNQNDMRILIGEMDSLEFCRRHLFDNTSWVFSSISGVNCHGSYDEFRLIVANAINTNPNNVAIIGSAKYGFSMAPSKAYVAFDLEKSDIDVIIVSSELFETVWKEIRTAIYAGYTHLKAEHHNEIIMRFLVFASHQKYSSSYLRETALTIEKLAASLNKATRITAPFKFRVYASWSDVELYHSHGVSQLAKVN